jgi:hypothetical protein
MGPKSVKKIGVLTGKKIFPGVIVGKDGPSFSPFWGSEGAKKCYLFVEIENRLGAKKDWGDSKVSRIV